MKKITTILMLLMLTCMGAWAQDSWPVNFDKSLRSTHASRYTDFVGLDDQKINIPGAAVGGLIYNDLTSESLTVAAGATVTPTFGYRGWAMYGYLYIDYNNDGDFTDDGELVSQLPGNNWASGSTADKTIPAFTVSNTEGTYRARFKVEWKNTDPGGNPNGSIAENGGCMVDVMITVIATTPEQEAAFEKVQSWLPFMQESLALVTDASNYISNARQQDSEGLYTSLLDKNNATYFHSAWGGTMASQPNHDLQARLPEAVNSFYLFYVTRSNGTGYPQAMRIDGSNNAADFTDAAAGGATWTNSVSSLSGLPSGATKSYLSDKITLSEAYQYLRFVPDVSYKATSWFCLAEFWLLPSNEAVDAAMTMMKNVNSVYDITAEMITEINQIDEDLRNTTAEVTYVVKDANGNPLFTSEPQQVAKGTTITTLPTDFQRPAFYTYNSVSETVDGNKTIEFTATLKDNAPVKFTEDATNPHYYNMNIRSQYLVYDETNEDKVKLQATSEPFNPNAAWAFIGNPYDGFSVINQTYGTSNVLTYTTASMSRPTTHNIQFQTGAEAEAKTWLIDTNNTGIVLRMKENTNIYFHHENGNNGRYLRTCSNSEWSAVHNDAGSTIILTTDEAALVQLYNLLKDAPIGEGPNKYSATGVNPEEILTNAGTVIDNEESSQYYDTYQALLNLQSGLTLNMPQAGMYRIKGNTSGKYLAAGLASNGKFNMTDAVDATTIFYFDGTKLVNYSDGKVNGMTASAWAWVYENGAVSTVEIQDGLTNGGYGIKSSTASFYDNGDNSASADRGNNVTINASTDARYTNWYFEEVTELPITLRSTDNETFFATFSAPVNVQISGASLNTVTNNNKTAAYNTVDTDMLKAGVGVLLSGTSETATATIITDEVPDADYGLVKYYAATAGTGDESMLYLGKGKTSGKAGFYKLGEGTTSNGFKAYLENSTEFGGAKEGFELEFAGVTGIENMENGTLNMENGAVYNLQGQRVNKAQKGVFIQNGKKVVLK